ncbi:hypothetical protein E2C01_093399 [Portunus trituberculatus]|uniref:Uncharacterized protein n=1 Tax=Portunus trituberculatus TaxID=210409 RepID=A0A5B7JYP0_PORTR|nr:hypothetical protein [Portunus trituberculatus]
MSYTASWPQACHLAHNPYRNPHLALHSDTLAYLSHPKNNVALEKNVVHAAPVYPTAEATTTATLPLRVREDMSGGGGMAGSSGYTITARRTSPTALSSCGNQGSIS